MYKKISNYIYGSAWATEKIEYSIISDGQYVYTFPHICKCHSVTFRPLVNMFATIAPNGLYNSKGGWHLIGVCI